MSGGLVPSCVIGIGDLTITEKCIALPTLWSLIVSGFAMQVPTGSANARDDARELMEFPTQMGRGPGGLI